MDSQTADIIMRGHIDNGLGGGNEHVVKKLIRDEFFDFKEKLVDGEAGSDVPGYPEPPLQSPLHKPRVGQKAGFFKKTQPGGFFWVLLGFIGFYWVFLGFF